MQVWVKSFGEVAAADKKTYYWPRTQDPLLIPTPHHDTVENGDLDHLSIGDHNILKT